MNGEPVNPGYIKWKILKGPNIKITYNLLICVTLVACLTNHNLCLTRPATLGKLTNS